MSARAELTSPVTPAKHLRAGQEMTGADMQGQGEDKTPRAENT